MSSWFQSAGLNSAFESLTEKVQAVSDSVQDAIPKEHKELLAKLTLNTEEMISERQNFGDEANRKAEAMERLNKMLPWESLDPEREILVEECKDAILELSAKEETFHGPFEMPLLNVQLDDETNENETESEGEEEPEGGKEEDRLNDGSRGEANVDAVGDEQEHLMPSDESREMLAKLEPLPPMLDNFDLDEHVGLIQKVLKEDPKLVEMQAYLSGGGIREKIFWRNYFFHCAYTRYKCGLSIDEIWCYQEVSNVTNNVDATSTEYDDSEVAATYVKSAVEEKVIAFDGPDVEELATISDTAYDENVDSTGNNDTAAISLGTPNSGFELVDDIGEVGEDPELDELEAEIARELED
mmetsp:Transcript_23020/g.54349  ORF Transcript_23020/g.54349 Transcript_23020/m.54349 type:complete len:355 (-) Transcript_23020:166-1230(-)